MERWKKSYIFVGHVSNVTQIYYFKFKFAVEFENVMMSNIRHGGHKQPIRGFEPARHVIFQSLKIKTYKS